jgi:hypothetical protein
VIHKVGSPYSSAWSRKLISVLYGVLFAFCLSGLISGTDNDQNRGAQFAALLCSSWLIVGPLLTYWWHCRWDDFEKFLAFSFQKSEIGTLNSIIVKVEKLRFFIVPLPVLLIAVAFEYGREFFDTSLSLGDNWLEYWIIPLVLGALVAGWGVWCAILSLAMSLEISKHIGDFSPFAGVVSMTNKKLSDFCFGTARIFGIGATVVLPVFFVGIFETSGRARLVLYFLIALVVVVIIALLALPAWAISRQVEGERQRYLDELSIEIEHLVGDLRSGDHNSNVPVWNANVTMRLNALLEVRKHVMVHMTSDTALKMVRRIPFILIGPIGSSIVAWLGLVFGKD